MTRWNAKKIAEASKKDFEKTWNETKNRAYAKVSRKQTAPQRKGTTSPVFEAIQKLRSAYIKMGFDEIINPLFIEDKDVHKQFGPEAVAVLDRCYYIGGLPRPDIGISDKKISEIARQGLKADKKVLQSIFRNYKKGELGGDDLVSQLAKALKTSEGKALKILQNLFPEMKNLKPEVTEMTLRSHMTSGWFLTLQALYKKAELPLKLFSIDRCFRREQREDKGHLRTYHSASSIILDDEVSLEMGEEVVKGLLKDFGFTDFRFTPDEKRSKYYAPDTQTEVYGRSPTGEWIEIATFGMYSPVALSKYGIDPVMNLGLGVERLAMIISGTKDIRELAYPQFYSGIRLTDEEVVDGISIDKKPLTGEGKNIVEHIIETAVKHKDAQSPCRFEAYKGPLMGKQVKVSVVEVEKNTKLLGPAALNRIAILDGNIYGVSESKGPKDVLLKGTLKGISYIEALANLAAYEIENAAKLDEKKTLTRVKGVKIPSEINLKISDVVVRYINSNNKKIDIRGPVFTTIEAEL